MKILYTGVRADNYDPARQFGFEYNNFFLTLQHMPGVEVIEHPYDRIVEVGKKKFNEELWDIVQKEKPDLLFAFMYTDELDKKVLARIKSETQTKSVAWFADDYWRFFNYSKHWPPYFTYVVTTYHKAVDWYKKAGHDNVIHSQWACNTAVFKPTNVPVQDIDVSLVGQFKPARGKIVAELAKQGINVQAFGHGWPNGRVSAQEMQSIIGRSKINLNLNVRAGLLSPAVIGRLVLKRSVNHLVPDFHFIDNLRAYLHFPILHLHARPFELAGMNAFVISGYADGIEEYYENGKEMVIYKDTNDLVEKIRYYLLHDAEREAIRKAGYERTLREHTYEKRFNDLFTILWPNR